MCSQCHTKNHENHSTVERDLLIVEFLRDKQRSRSQVTKFIDSIIKPLSLKRSTILQNYKRITECSSGKPKNDQLIVKIDGTQIDVKTFGDASLNDEDEDELSRSSTPSYQDSVPLNFFVSLLKTESNLIKIQSVFEKVLKVKKNDDKILKTPETVNTASELAQQLKSVDPLSKLSYIQGICKNMEEIAQKNVRICLKLKDRLQGQLVKIFFDSVQQKVAQNPNYHLTQKELAIFNNHQQVDFSHFEVEGKTPFKIQDFLGKQQIAPEDDSSSDSDSGSHPDLNRGKIWDDEEEGEFEHSEDHFGCPPHQLLLSEYFGEDTFKKLIDQCKDKEELIKIINY